MTGDMGVSFRNSGRKFGEAEGAVGTRRILGCRADERPHGNQGGKQQDDFSRINGGIALCADGITEQPAKGDGVRVVIVDPIAGAVQTR